ILPVRKPDRWGGADQAFRVPDNEFLAKVMESFGEPVLSTSANRKGEPPARSGQELEKNLGKTLPLIIDAGPSQAKEPSTLVRWIGEKSEILRVGAYPTEGLLDPPSEAP
ncbi:MAG: hypothetical protein HKN21_06785, partial [Candidatus Eisenbacteria bacterium]|nr:hypothetical protein [Candidatus Eisenbacteria bacterium]